MDELNFFSDFESNKKKKKKKKKSELGEFPDSVENLLLLPAVNTTQTPDSEPTKVISRHASS